MSTHKLTNVEAQRIMAILEETYSKIQLLSYVPPLRRVPDFESFQDEVGPEVAQVLEGPPKMEGDSALKVLAGLVQVLLGLVQVLERCLEQALPQA